MYRISIPQSWIPVRINRIMYSTLTDSQFKHCIKQYNTWCRQHIGSQGHYWFYDQHRTPNIYYFYHSDHAAAFKLAHGF